MIDHILIDPGRFQSVINIYLNLSLALNSDEAKQFKTLAEYRDDLVIKATVAAYKHIWDIVDNDINLWMEDENGNNHFEMDFQNRDDEIQDLKLENDRLKQREELMLHFIRSVACEFSCKECDITGDRNLCHYLTSSDSKSTGTRMRASAEKLLSKLEDL